MEKIVLREFQRNLHKLIKSGESFLIISGLGKVLGVFSGRKELNEIQFAKDLPPKTDDGHAYLSQKAVAIPVEVKSYDGHALESHNQDVLPEGDDNYHETGDGHAPVCAKCHKPAEYEGTFWEDGEEYFLKLCAVCSKRVSLQRKKKIN
jgi:hypothetical protein